MKHSGLRGNRSDQLLVRQRKSFLMFRLIIDQRHACLTAASCLRSPLLRALAEWRDPRGDGDASSLTFLWEGSLDRQRGLPPWGLMLPWFGRSAPQPPPDGAGGLAGPSAQAGAPNAPRCPGLGPGATPAAGDLHFE